MKTPANRSFLSLILILSAGCASYNHSAVLPSGRKEVTTVSTLLMKADVNTLATKVTESANGAYSRSVGAGSINTIGDAAMLQTLIQAAFEAGKKSTIP